MRDVIATVIALAVIILVLVTFSNLIPSVAKKSVIDEYIELKENLCKYVHVTYSLVNRTNTTATVRITMKNQYKYPVAIDLAIARKFVKLPWAFLEDPENYAGKDLTTGLTIKWSPLSCPNWCRDSSCPYRLKKLFNKYLQYWNSFVLKPNEKKEIIVTLNISGRIAWLSQRWGARACLREIPPSPSLGECRLKGCECSVCNSAWIIIKGDKLFY